MKALIVEDYSPLQKSVTQAIREIGWAADAASDGEEGKWFAANHQYDVIVLDIMLPKISGLDVLRSLREQKILTPVILLTAKDGLDDRTRGLDMGADDYLVKPFFLGELISRLKALVRRSYRQQDPVIRVGDLSIDTSSRIVHVGANEISFTAREYALLEYLARRTGELVTRTEIWDHLYETYGGTTSNVVDVYIGYLRKKLRRPHQPDMIQTRRGQGYRLKDGE